MKQLFLFLLIWTVLGSCTDNEILFDLNSQSVISCNSSGIRNLHVENINNKEYYMITWQDSIHDAPKKFSFESKNRGYKIEEIYPFRELPQLNLASMSQYIVTKSGGDASSHEIEIWTDKNGKVYKTSKNSCR